MFTCTNPITRQSVSLLVGLHVSDSETPGTLLAVLKHQYAKQLSLSDSQQYRLMLPNGFIWLDTEIGTESQLVERGNRNAKQTSRKLKDVLLFKDQQPKQVIEVLEVNTHIVRVIDIEDRLVYTKYWKTPSDDVTVKKALSETAPSGFRRQMTIPFPFGSYDIWLHKSSHPYYHCSAVRLFDFDLQRRRLPLRQSIEAISTPDTVTVTSVVQVRPYTNTWRNICIGTFFMLSLASGVYLFS